MHPVTENSWWDEYGLLPGYAELLSLESKAERLLVFNASIVSGLLQTTQYARAVMEQTLAFDHAPHTLSKWVEARMQRQWAFFERTKPVQHYCILEEPALYRVFGNRAIMQEQLRHLIRMSESSNVHLQILPMNVQASWPMATSGIFSIYYLPDSRVLSIEDAFKGQISSFSDIEVTFYESVFHKLRALSPDPKASIALINKALERMEEAP